MTGVHPGRHGIFDFTQREIGRYRVRFVNGTHRRVPTVWRMLSDAGRRVCVLGLPGTYPPEAVNGILVSGFDTPVTTRADDSFVFPPSFARQLGELGGFPFADFQEFVVDRNWYRMARARLLRGIERKLRLSCTLLKRERWDCFLILFGESDTASHHFWHFFDAQSPLHDPVGASEYGATLYEVYAHLDEALGTLWREVPEANVLVVSDHGFQGASGQFLHLNRWLAENGWLRFASHAYRLDWTPLKHAALRWIPARWQARLFRWHGYNLANHVETKSRFAGIDFEHTLAFSEEVGTCPGVWINLAGRERAGTVAPQDYERIREEIIEALRRLVAPENGGRVIKRVWRREELYKGPYVHLAPDILFELGATASGYAYQLASSGGMPGPFWRKRQPTPWAGGKLLGLSGVHRQEGIFALAGPNVDGGDERMTVDMAQMTPTILSLCGVSFGGEFFDGETLRAVVTTRHRVGSTQRDVVHAPQPYSPDEEAEIEERLRNLGYLD